MLDDLERLLTCDSPLARQVRCLLRGLLAGIEEGTKLASTDDPASNHARIVLQSIRELLTMSFEDRSPTELRLDSLDSPSNSEASLESGTALSEVSPVEELAVEMFGSPDIQEALGVISPPDWGDASFWRTIQHSLLRVSPVCRTDWQARWSSLVVVGSEPLEAIPSNVNQLVYPAFGISSGLQSSTSAPLHPRLRAIPELPVTDPAVQVVSTLLWFIEHEPRLRHVYRPLYAFGFAAVDERFAVELVERLRRVFATRKDADPIKQFRTRIDLDEAIHSLTFEPLPAPDSWWRSLQQRSRDRLFDLRRELLDAGQTVHLQVLTDQYAEIRSFTKDDLGVDCGGKPGEVVSCLRVFARIDQQVYPGRVLYRRL